MDTKRDNQQGLVGGSIERRIATSRVPPLEHPFVLAPFRRPEDQAALGELLEGTPIQIEIGFGRSHHLLDLAEASADHLVLGFEIKRQWVAQASRGALRRGLGNVRVIEGDARPFLQRLVQPGSVDAIHILFPDPWWKRRHHKRRVFSDPWLELVTSLLRAGGSLIAKTDVPAYADLMERSAARHSGLRLHATHAGDGLLASVPRSHREKKCAEYRIPVYAFRFVKETPL